MPSDLKRYLKKPPTKVFFCEISQIFTNIFFTEHLGWLPLGADMQN